MKSHLLQELKLALWRHYSTETLGEVIRDQLDVEVEFLDLPNEV